MGPWWAETGWVLHNPRLIRMTRVGTPLKSPIWIGGGGGRRILKAGKSMGHWFRVELFPFSVKLDGFFLSFFLSFLINWTGEKVKRGNVSFVEVCVCFFSFFLSSEFLSVQTIEGLTAPNLPSNWPLENETQGTESLHIRLQQICPRIKKEREIQLDFISEINQKRRRRRRRRKWPPPGNGREKSDGVGGGGGGETEEKYIMKTEEIIMISILVNWYVISWIRTSVNKAGWRGGREAGGGWGVGDGGKK